MKLYLSVIGIAVAVISALNIAFSAASAVTAVGATVLCTALQFAIDGLIAIIINKLPDRLFGVDKALFSVSPWEEKLYKRLRVRAWKDKVWELGWLGGFSKKRLLKPNSKEYMEKFIIECNKGVLTHRLSYPAGFLPMLFYPEVLAFSIALPVGTVNLLLNILPTLVLRYNTPKLKSVLLRMRRKTQAG
ncbi:MAG: hypothetical protein IKM46_05605 [Clostridia bacterium]|nr:hypothetical protein [Clostridia bacterium]